MLHPLLAPLGPQPDIPPDVSPEDKAAFLTSWRWEQYTKMGMESCAAKTVLSGVVGFGLGAFISLMSASMQYEDPMLRAANASLSTAAKASQVFKEMGLGMWRSGKGFGKVGALYAGTECVIESYRAKNDMTNAVAAGFVSGAILGRNAGPQGAIGGGLAFAAFSAAIDAFMRRETKEED